MFLAGCTPFQPRVWKIMGNFGSRLFFLNMSSPDKDCATLAEQLRSKYSPKRKEKICREATNQLFERIFKGVKAIKWSRKEDNESLLREIAIIAKLVASLRGTINVWQDGGDGEEYNFTASQIEKPDRINQALYNLARGHAVACERSHITDEDIAIVLRVALSSGPIDRTKLFNLLISHEGVLTSQTIMDELGFSRKTALRLMAMFCLLKITEEDESLAIKTVRSEKVVKITKEFSWFVGERLNNLTSLLRHTKSN
jgi:hypothetical protein